MTSGRRVALALVAICVFAIGSCSKQSPGTKASDPSPARSAEQYLKALASGDCKAVKQIVVAPGSVDCGSVAEVASSGALTVAQVEESTFKVVDQGGGAATVDVVSAGEDEPSTIDLVQEKGKWRVVVDAGE